MNERIRIGHFFEGRKYFWLMHLSYGTWTEKDRREHWEYARTNSRIGLDLVEEVPKKWKYMSESEKQTLHAKSPNWYNHFEWFCDAMKPDDLVIAVHGQDSILGIGTLIQSDPPYGYDKELRGKFFDHFRNVKWDPALPYDDRIQLSTKLLGFDRTLLKVKANTRFWEILSDAYL